MPLRQYNGTSDMSGAGFMDEVSSIKHVGYGQDGRKEGRVFAFMIFMGSYYCQAYLRITVLKQKM